MYGILINKNLTHNNTFICFLINLLLIKYV